MKGNVLIIGDALDENMGRMNVNISTEIDQSGLSLEDLAMFVLHSVIGH